MILTPHLLLGAAIASKISNPLLALPLAFLSHYFLDSLPHKEYSIANINQKQWDKSFFDFLKVFLDIFLGGTLILLFSGGNLLLFFIALSAIVPDGITLLSRIIPRNKLLIQHQKVHIAVNRVIDNDPYFLGTVSQIAVIIIAILLLR